ncbi:fluoride efflux transporter CrcB [Aquibacillus sp. 3ASR75-11]|uniref:Fluoride-specific ion channel FluC n=1 Tax=Terrihalobacillus insolitus TaxID=2950438 RepID=A0A9X3WRT7_9BACI|nr:fluoride efflux transporter CrcB [Terrihalobacillus insolitus]MDC3412866.1 fluoride efflux transporter CrcB [Terrihalobacillus insolitus]MDC3423658.1 fluoride efflux transporter CrcB [Terrihalobacillus insolitus]
MNVLAVGIGGFIGAILRYLVGEWIPSTNGFPFGTWTVNLIGCLILSWFFTITSKRWSINPNLKLAIGTGLIGSFTTFSTFSVETINLIQNSQFMIALLYILLSVIGGIGLAFTGARLASFQPNRKREEGAE